jgi:hypothetical protein
MASDGNFIANGVHCGVARLSFIEKGALGLSSAYLLIIAGRQLYESCSRNATTMTVLPLHFKFFSVACFSVLIFSGSILYGYDDQDNLPYALSALIQALIGGIAMAVGLFLAQDNPGSRAINKSVVGGILYGAYKFVFVFAVVQWAFGDTKRLRRYGKNSLSIAWIVYDGSQALAFALVMMYARLQGQPRPGVLIYCCFQVGIYCSFMVQGMLYYHAIHGMRSAAAQCLEVANLSVFFAFWPWVLYWSLQQDSTYWRKFSMTEEDFFDEHEHKAALLGPDHDLNERVKVLDYYHLHLTKKIGEGGTAVVYRGEYHSKNSTSGRSTILDVAVKVVDCKEFNKHMVRQTLTEVNILSQIRCVRHATLSSSCYPFVLMPPFRPHATLSSSCHPFSCHPSYTTLLTSCTVSLPYFLFALLYYLQTPQYHLAGGTSARSSSDPCGDGVRRPREPVRSQSSECDQEAAAAG